MNIFAIEGNEETGEIDWEKSAQSQATCVWSR